MSCTINNNNNKINNKLNKLMKYATYVAKALLILMNYSNMQKINTTLKVIFFGL